MYKQIADYGLIGDMHSVALVSNEGSIDYCTMPYIHSPTVFASLLDDKKGGRFSIRPRMNFSHHQKYLTDTNILSTEFRTSTGSAELVDFMPVQTNKLYRKEHMIQRCLESISGRIDFILELSPRPQYARIIPKIRKNISSFQFSAGSEIYTLFFDIKRWEIKQMNQGTLIIAFSLNKGEKANFSFIYGQGKKEEKFSCSVLETEQFWKDWLTTCLGERTALWEDYNPMITRSLLVLKLLTFQPTGAISAAATTSLPESLGGERNWDYRFTWIRDASFTLKAMFSLGHLSEADSFIHWLHGIYQKYGSDILQIMYSLEGEADLKEEVLTHLKGYKNSRPVRVGNGAYLQKQWDIYGEVMDSALRLSGYAGKIDEKLWPFFVSICNLACKNWFKADEGIWEVRNGPFHFVYSKVMCWVALDRGMNIARRYGLEAPLTQWKKVADDIKREVLEKGYNDNINSFTQYYGSDELDASLLLLPLMKFLPVDDWRIQSTIGKIKENLIKDGFLRRYKSQDGLKGEEGSFLICNFWLIECLVLLGKVDEAKQMLNQTIKAANHLGLFSEEYNTENGQMLGNFPQAFSHIGYINAAVSILNAERKRVKEEKNAPSLSTKMRKLIPTRVFLNQKHVNYTETSAEISARLKILLNTLQGAFFNIEEGKVNYQGMKRSKSFREYLELTKMLNNFSPSILKDDEEKKAFWTNIYNILIIHGVIELEVQRSVMEIVNFFRRIGYFIGGLFFSPDDIEHGILRSNKSHPLLPWKQFSRHDQRNQLIIRKFDPRIHFSLVCAASSCPPVEFYDAEKINKQLDISARSFLNRRGIILDREKKILYLSKIFQWYSGDFGSNWSERLIYIASFIKNEKRSYILNHLNELKIQFLPYQWNLNETLK